MFTASALSMGTRSVNLNLETSLLFDSDDRRHLPLLKSMRSILDTIYKSLSPGDPTLRSTNENGGDPSPGATLRATDENGKDILTKFLKELGAVVLNYEDHDVRAIIEVLNEDINSYYEKKKAVDDPMVFNPKLRMYVKNKLKEWMSSNPFELKDKITSFVKNINSYNILEDFNEAFSTDDELTLNMFLNDLKEYPKTRNVSNLSSLVKDIGKFVIFKRYDNLNEIPKTKLQNAVNNLFGNGITRDQEETSSSNKPKMDKNKKVKNETTLSDDSEASDGEVKLSLSQDEKKSEATTNSIFY